MTEDEYAFRVMGFAIRQLLGISVRQPMAEPDPPQGPVDVNDVLNAHNQLEQATKLSDIGVGNLAWWRVSGVCSKHGKLTRFEETAGHLPRVDRVQCIACRNEGMTRTVLVDEIEAITGITIVGEENK